MGNSIDFFEWIDVFNKNPDGFKVTNIEISPGGKAVVMVRNDKGEHGFETELEFKEDIQSFYQTVIEKFIKFLEWKSDDYRQKALNLDEIRDLFAKDLKEKYLLDL